MKQEKFEVRLLRQINNEWQTIKIDYVWEFDDECVNANAFYQAYEKFKSNIQNYDVIQCLTGTRNYTQIINDRFITC